MPSRREFVYGALAAGLGATLSRGAMGAPPVPCVGTSMGIPGYGFFQALDVLRELGFTAVELSPRGRLQPTPGMYPGFEFDRLSREERRKIRKALRGFRRISSHLPFTDLHYFSRFERVAEFAHQQIKNAIEATGYFGGEIAVVHTMPAYGQTREQLWPVMIRRYREWGEIARKAGCRLAVETGTGYPGSAREFVQLIKEIDHAWVGSTLDVGHEVGYEEVASRMKRDERGAPEAVRTYNGVLESLVGQLGGKLWHLHVHDVAPKTWKDHQPIGTGIVDFPRVIAALARAGYKGMLVMEVDGPADVVAKYMADGKRRLEDLVARQTARNRP